MIKREHIFFAGENLKMVYKTNFFFLHHFFSLPKPGNLVLTPAVSGVLLARQPKTDPQILQAEGSSASSATTDRVVFTRL